MPDIATIALATLFISLYTFAAVLIADAIFTASPIALNLMERWPRTMMVIKVSLVIVFTMTLNASIVIGAYMDIRYGVNPFSS